MVLAKHKLKSSFFIKICGVFTVAIFVYSCASKPYASSNTAYAKQAKAMANILKATPLTDSFNLPYSSQWVGTTNFSMRKPNYVVIHHTAQNSCEQTLKTFTLPRTQVSAHYVICRNGTIFQMLNDYLRAHHAGVSTWGNNTDINSSSIGIELDNNGAEPFAKEQMESLSKLLLVLKNKYKIPAANFIGHGDIAPTRKNDPSILFDWKTLAQQGFGLWYADTTNLQLPVNFNKLQALKLIGYSVKDTSAAIMAFKRHYMNDSTAVMEMPQQKILYATMQAYW